MSSISSAAKNGQPPPGVWAAIAPYVIPRRSDRCHCFALSGPDREDLAAKGLAIPPLSLRNGVKEGLVNAPKVGAIVGVQMGLQKVVERQSVNMSTQKGLRGSLLALRS